MKEQVRESLGKAAYEAEVRWVKDGTPLSQLLSWEQLTPDAQELRKSQAEAVVRHLAAMIGVPMLQLLLSEDDVKSILEQLWYEQQLPANEMPLSHEQIEEMIQEEIEAHPAPD
jgi:uncharacterized protein (DUF2126 family)